jgi:hypothetical protein
MKEAFYLYVEFWSKDKTGYKTRKIIVVEYPSIKALKEIDKKIEGAIDEQ